MNSDNIIEGGKRPLIGITMRHDVERGRFYLAPDYAEAVEAAGGAPIHIALIPNAEYIKSVAENLCGVLLPGSASDVDPQHYGQEPQAGLGSVHPRRDAVDLMLLEIVERWRMPLFAICFGMQVWNVSRGGTLLQDIADELPDAIKHVQEGVREHRSHRVTIREESRLYNLANSVESYAVNSHHHQGVATQGKNLRVTARAAGDDLIEAIESEDYEHWTLGVQWHPEVDWQNDNLSRRAFAAFVEAAREYAIHKTKSIHHASVR